MPVNARIESILHQRRVDSYCRITMLSSEHVVDRLLPCVITFEMIDVWQQHIIERRPCQESRDCIKG